MRHAGKMGRAGVRVEFEPRFCANHVVDLTAGCSFGCIYCPFSDLSARRLGVRRPVALSLEDVDRLPAPPSVFLSPASDPFAPQAAAGTHALLSHLLPRGTNVGILTKGVIPDATLDLLAAYPRQVEGVAIGVTSLDDHRNEVLEPGCPPAMTRLGNIERVAARGLIAALRIDPLFPDIDDRPESLDRLLDEAARRGANAVTATYVFTWGRYLRQLQKAPLLAASIPLLDEPAPMEGGTAFSVPLARKLETYTHLATEARARGLYFNTCGCKDLRVRDTASFSTRCRNPFFFEPGAITRNADSPEPAPATPFVQPAGPPSRQRELQE
jgi:DNA repair photolyase